VRGRIERKAASDAGTAGCIAARVLVRIADYVAARGHDVEALCRSVGLSASALNDPDLRVPYPVAERLGTRAADLTGDANIGLHLAHAVRDTGRYDAGVLLLMASASVRIALQRMVRHQRHWGDGERAHLVPTRGGMCVRYALPGARAAPGYRRQADECAMAEIAIGVRLLSGRDVAPRVVRFRHAAPRDVREHETLFRCPLEFGAGHTEIVLDDAVLDAPMLHANEAYAAIFEQQLERALARLPRQAGAAPDVRAAARAALVGGRCTLAGTARMLGVSPRTMQRRLQSEGTSFGDLVDELRREMALAYLERNATIQETAWLLGYRDATAFHHAFKRWTGTTPGRTRGVAARES
jgi:AraC-like DNA-binding protein